MFKISNYIVKSEIPSESAVKDIAIFSTRTGNIIVVKEDIVNNLEKANFQKVDFRVINLLLKYKILVLEEEKEISTILEENTYIMKKKDGISFTIQPTGNCQLGCHYCGQSHSKIKMDDNLVQKSFERISNTVKTNNYKLLSITWYGGEPLLAAKIILYFSEKITKFCFENDVHYKADIITNGVLLKPNLFEKLVVDSNIRHFQITLDGLKEFHDKRRMTKGGEGSFDVIMQNLIKCLNSETFDKYNPSINIRLNINSENVESVEQLIYYFYELGLIKKVQFTFSPVFDWGGNRANERDNLTIGDFSSREIDWILKINDLGGEVQVSLPERQAVPCMVGVENSEVIDAFGNIFSCYELPYTPAYQNDNYIEGNIITGKPI
ncbi:MAG: radical SAM protein, partial [Mycoplasma sp.]|nr:radical SAM protein [Mycoplasma sp.]